MSAKLEIEDLVETHYDAVFRFLWQLTRHRENAEDLTQQTFLKAQSRLSSFRGESSVRTWLHAIAYREFTTWRRLRWLKGISLRADQKAPDLHGIAVEGLWLLDALDKLNPALSEAFILHEVQGLTVEEISQVTGSPAGTVKSRLHHARARLQHQWDETKQEIDYEPKLETS